MGFMNWLMNGVGFENEEVYDDTIEKSKRHEEKLQLQRERARQKAEIRAKKAQAKADRAAERYALKQTKDVPEKTEETVSTYSENPVGYNYNPTLAGFNSNSTNVGGYGSKSVEFVYPTSFDDVTKVIGFLKEGESVMLNLNQMNEVESQRLLDCTSGAVYALNGNIRHVESNIYLITPEGFNIKAPNYQTPNEPQQ